MQHSAIIHVLGDPTMLIYGKACVNHCPSPFHSRILYEQLPPTYQKRNIVRSLHLIHKVKEQLYKHPSLPSIR